VKVIDDILSQQELDYINQQFVESLTGEWQINQYHWQDILTVGSDGFVLMQNVNDNVRTIVEHAIKEHVQFAEPPGIMFYMWTTGSGISWHHDDHVKQACTIYLEDWPIDFGGQFVYKEDRANKMIPVRTNRLIVNDNHTEHMVTKVKKNKDKVRYTLQVFGS
jgi:hypothetical protein